MNIKEKKIIVESAIIDKLKNVYDPEIPVNIYELGLIYEVNLDDELNAHIVMTLTAPNCPVAETMPVEVREAAEAVQEVIAATVELTFEPPWTMDMMTEAAKLDLGFL